MILFNTYTPGQINNAGTNKGFRPLLQFSDEDVKQVLVCETLLAVFIYLFILIIQQLQWGRRDLNPRYHLRNTRSYQPVELQGSRQFLPYFVG